jgi:LysR family nitrogen assimilation transcriptional regulator
MNLRQLTYFVRTVEIGNITRAAQQLHVAQPALGLQIRQLEAELGIALIRRHSRGVSATPAGQKLYEQSLDILRRMDAMKRDIMAMGAQPQERITLGLTPGLVTLLGSSLLFAARTDLPWLQISLVEEMSHVLVDTIQRRDADLALSYEVKERPGLVRTAMLEEEMLLVTANPKDGAKSKPVSIDEVLARPLVLTGERDPVRQKLEAAAEQRGLKLTPAFEASSVGAIKSLVARGVGCGVMAYGSAATEIRAGQLGFRRIHGDELVRTLHLIQSSQRPALPREAALQAFIAKCLLGMADELGVLVRPLPRLFAEARKSVDLTAGVLPEKPLLAKARKAPKRIASVDPLLPDGLWSSVAPLLPMTAAGRQGGRPAVSDRAALTGILYVLRSDCEWGRVPPEIGCSGKTCRRRLQAWRDAGKWPAVQRLLRRGLPDADALAWSRLR